MIDLCVGGKTKVLGLIGDPVEHTFSPLIQNSIAKKAKEDILYLPFHVRKEGLEYAVKGAYELGVKGLNVTVPHKKAVLDYLCGIDKKARAIGAVNTLKYTKDGYYGYNTDVLGIKSTFENNSISLKGKKVLIIGAGGSACSSLVLACESKAEKIIIANRTVENALKLIEHVKGFYDFNAEAISIDNIDNIKDLDIVIQNTTVGFGDKVKLSPVSSDFFKKRNIEAALDVIYTPWKTAFLKLAEGNCTALNGFDMLFYQAAAAREIWLDKQYDIKMKLELKKEIGEYMKNSLL